MTDIWSLVFGRLDWRAVPFHAILESKDALHMASSLGDRQRRGRAGRGGGPSCSRLC